ncbi:MAG: sulfatase [Candidatus Promineifilaceae bacterium]|nr:sulfatase [Candidatus Promineifilaceae bacterium]
MIRSKRIIWVMVMLFTATAIPIWVTAWFSVAAAAQVKMSDENPPHIIFIVVDSLRADHVSSYGYERSTTPNLDMNMAAQGALFTDVTAASSWTNPSNGAMLTSHTPSAIDTVWSDIDRSIPEDEVLLAEYLQDAGYQTVGFVSNYWMRHRFGYAQGFDVYEGTSGENTQRAVAINNLATNWLNDNLEKLNNSGQPLFLFLYYLDPHSWYDPLPPYDTLYDSAYTGTLTAEVFGHGQDVVAGTLVPTERDIEHLLALYDGEITYWDFYLGQMFTYLDENGVLENSIMIVTSDHGEMFGEHGKWVHANSLYEEVLRIPLLFRYPGMLAPGQVLTTPVHMMDIAPTLLDMIGIPVPDHMQGQSLLAIMQGRHAPASRPIFSEMPGETDPEAIPYWIAPHTNVYSVKQDGLKLIHYQQGPVLGELYDVQPTSVYEVEDLASQEPAIANRLFAQLQEEFAIPTRHWFLPFVEAQNDT